MARIRCRKFISINFYLSIIVFLIQVCLYQDLSADDETITVISHAKEKYRCHLPKISKKDDEQEKATLEISVLEYLEPLFKGDVCSYRIESYWTYEICHGNYIKQYHEERDGKTSKLQVNLMKKIKHSI